jgi:ferredoxin/nitrate reductase assembly molybdenum cofactor insertion protein NarJ
MDINAPRSGLYHFLAEALSEPPDWLALSGREWPLYEAAIHLAPESEAARKAVVAMMEIGEEPLKLRQDRYSTLFSSHGRPHLWIYESGALKGRLFTEDTLDVEQWYQSAGLDVLGAELPDHASLELEFLAYLSGAEQIDFSRIELGFLQRHAGRWLPDLGHAMLSSGDPVYAPIGQLLMNWMAEANPQSHNPGHSKGKTIKPSKRLPTLHFDRVEDCTLCGFCVQRCPVRALRIDEDHQTTSLQMSTKRCVGCGRCARACAPGVLVMEESFMSRDEVPPVWDTTLRQSPRISCQVCGTPLVSQAEVRYVSSRLGHPNWLELCQDCRSEYLERE